MRVAAQANLIAWPSWKADKDNFLYISDPLELKQGFSKIELTTKMLK